MKNRSAFLVRIVPVVAAFISSVASAQNIQWDGSKAIAVGSACSSTGNAPDTFFVAAGEDVAVIFTDFGIDLTGDDAESTAVHSCLVRLPITVAANVALAELTQQLHWGYSKDRGTEAQVFANGTFFGIPTKGIRAEVGKDVEGVESFLTEEAVDTFLHMRGRFCKTRPYKGLLSINLSLSARRRATDRNISVRIHGEDIRYEALATWVGC